MVYKTNEQLMREIAKMKAEREVRKSFMKQDAERKALKKMVFVMKHEKPLKVARKLGMGARSLGRGGLKMLSDYHKYQQAKNKPVKRRK